MRVGYTSEFLACSAPYSCSRFVLSSPLVASPFHIYNVYLSGVLGHLPCYPDSAVFFKGFESAAGMRVRGKHMTMSDPLAKIKRKLQEEIDQLSHELNIELPKEIAVARAATYPKTQNTNSPRSARPTSTPRLHNSRSVWATSACSTSTISPKTAPGTARASWFSTSLAT